MRLTSLLWASGFGVIKPLLGFRRLPILEGLLLVTCKAGSMICIDTFKVGSSMPSVWTLQAALDSSSPHEAPISPDFPRIAPSRSTTGADSK